MKKTAGLLLVFILVLCAFLAVTVQADTENAVTRDGLELRLTTDKESYEKKEDIKITLEINNRNPYTVDGINGEIALPEGLSGEATNFTAVSIGANEMYYCSTTAKLAKTAKSSSEEGGFSAVWILVIALAALLIAGAVILVLLLKRKKATKVLSIFLCFALLMAMLPAGALAAEERITLQTSITVKNKAYTIQAAVWIAGDSAEEKCMLVFQSNGGDPVETQNVDNGDTAIEPEPPKKEGNLFAGWYIDEEFTELFDFSQPVKRSRTLYARWVDISNTTDSDSDGLIDTLEAFYGTDASVADTDGDDLSDYIETALLKYDPLQKDSDNNGTTDDQEDFDGDGLNNKRETELNTDPSKEDTDGDGLKDGDELNTHSTDPAREDTDNDGANDGWEVSNGFDPSSYNSTFRVTVKTEKTEGMAASVSMSAAGGKVASLKVQPVDPDREPLLSDKIPGYLGKAYDFSVEGDFYSATIAFEYDTSLGAISDQFQPRIYYFNEELGTLEELENQTVVAGKVTAEVSHFSKYILLNKTEFDKVWENEIKPPLTSDPEKEGTLDIMFVVDYSKSMNDNDPYHLFKSVSEQFINKLREGKDQAGAVKFIRQATLVSELTTNKQSVITAINGIAYDDGFGFYSGTDGSIGIKTALDELDKSDSGYQIIVFITDGADNGFAYSYDDLVQQAKDSGVVIYAIGMGGASEAVLRQISSQTGGKYYHATTGVSVDDLVSLDEVFTDIEEGTINLTADANEDKIPDYYNDLIRDGILLLSNGSNQFKYLDFNYDRSKEKSADYDGDGILNGEELRVCQVGTAVYLVMESDPTLADSDGDGILDGEDKDPLVWNVSYRDLALLANAVYENYGVGAILSRKDLEMQVDGYGLAGSTDELKGWEVVESVYNPYTGFEAAAYAKDNSIVIATRGSEAHDLADILQDWVVADVIGYLLGLNAQLPAMETFISVVAAKYGDRYDHFYVTGHSLGGYLALMAGSQLVINGLEHKIDGVVTFNGLGMSSMNSLTYFLDLDDNINLQKIRGEIKNYRTLGDVVACIGYTPGDDITVPQASSLGGWSIGNAHSLITFVERFANEQRKPKYTNPPYHGLNDEH